MKEKNYKIIIFVGIIFISIYLINANTSVFDDFFRVDGKIGAKEYCDIEGNNCFNYTNFSNSNGGCRLQKTGLIDVPSNFCNGVYCGAYGQMQHNKVCEMLGYKFAATTIETAPSNPPPNQCSLWNGVNFVNSAGSLDCGYRGITKIECWQEVCSGSLSDTFTTKNVSVITTDCRLVNAIGYETSQVLCNSDEMVVGGGTWRVRCGTPYIGHRPIYTETQKGWVGRIEGGCNSQTYAICCKVDKLTVLDE
jgi:hypothetical protein